ncbi:MAG: hypothetical protein GF375_04100 [Candidatus Omnitrophica bacterium]|nr:hypothetical protein [Candidatus Omnitrophota bacterium]
MTAREWIEKVFAPKIEQGKIIIAAGSKKVNKDGKGRRTGARIYIEVASFEELFREEIEAGGSNAEIARRIADKKTVRKGFNHETNKVEDMEFDVGYKSFIEDMAAKGIFK